MEINSKYLALYRFYILALFFHSSLSHDNCSDLHKFVVRIFFFHLIKCHTFLGKLEEYSTIGLVGSLQQQAKSEYEILAFE